MLENKLQYFSIFENKQILPVGMVDFMDFFQKDFDIHQILEVGSFLSSSKENKRINYVKKLREKRS